MTSLNILVAINYLDKGSIEYLKGIENLRFLLDSGAFTAWKAGKEITLDQYISFIEKLPIEPWRYFTLDKIGDAKGTKENLDTILKAGLKPIPIFTRGDSFEELDHYYSVSDVVAIGGLVGTRGNKGFVKGIMEKIGNRKTHWLGFTSNDFIAHYKPFSCDSSSWAGAVRYGKIKLYTSAGRWMIVGKDEFRQMPSSQIRAIFDLYQEDPHRFKNQKEWINSGRGDNLLETMTTKSWTRFQIDIENRLGTKYFLACAGALQIKQMHEAHQFWLKTDPALTQSRA